MILSILATVAVLAAIAVIAAALVFAETTLVYIALGLGGLSVLLLLGALLQGRFGAGERDTARTDGLGKSSVPVAPAAVPGHTWRPEEPGRVPAPAREPVRDTPAQEPTARTREEEGQEDPEFEVPRWQTPTVGDWPEPVAVATPATHEEDERLPDPEDLSDEGVDQEPAFAYRVPEHTSRDDEPVDEAETPAGATVALSDDEGERRDDRSPQDVEDPESDAEPEPAMYVHRALDPSSGDESTGAPEPDTVSEAEASEVTEVEESEETSERAEKASEGLEGERSESCEGNDSDEPIEPLEAVEGDPDETAAFTYRIPEGVRPEAEADVALETPESVQTGPDTGDLATDADEESDASSERSEVEETSRDGDEPAEDDPDQTVVLTRESVETHSASDDEDNAVAYAAIFDETSTEDDVRDEADEHAEDEAEDEDGSEKKDPDPSGTN